MEGERRFGQLRVLDFRLKLGASTGAEQVSGALLLLPHGQAEQVSGPLFLLPHGQAEQVSGPLLLLPHGQAEQVSGPLLLLPHANDTEDDSVESSRD